MRDLVAEDDAAADLLELGHLAVDKVHQQLLGVLEGRNALLETFVWRSVQFFPTHRVGLVAFVEDDHGRDELLDVIVGLAKDEALPDGRMFLENVLLKLIQYKNSFFL